MKKIAVAAILLAVGLLLTEGHGQEREQAVPGKSIPSQHKTGVGKAAGSRTDHGKPVFSGRIVEVDAPSGTLMVKGKDATVTFDASNPTFSGYRTLSDIRTGDRVAVSYTADGIRVARLAGKAEEAVKSEPPARQPGGEASPEKRPKERKKLTRVQKKGNGEGFDDVDVNKDGRITPVELSVVITNITMDLFKQYDKNHNGCLDRAEFLEAMKQQKAAKGE